MPLRTSHLQFLPVGRASLPPHLWCSHQCPQRNLVVWIVMQRWHLIISAMLWTATAAGKMSKVIVIRICTQHLIWTVMIGLKSSRTVSKGFMGQTIEFSSFITQIDILLWSVIDMIKMFFQGEGGRPLKGCHWYLAVFIVIVAMTLYQPEAWIMRFPLMIPLMTPLMISLMILLRIPLLILMMIPLMI